MRPSRAVEEGCYQHPARMPNLASWDSGTGTIDPRLLELDNNQPFAPDVNFDSAAPSAEGAVQSFPSDDFSVTYVYTDSGYHYSDTTNTYIEDTNSGVYNYNYVPETPSAVFADLDDSDDTITTTSSSGSSSTTPQNFESRI